MWVAPRGARPVGHSPSLAQHAEQRAAADADGRPELDDREFAPLDQLIETISITRAVEEGPGYRGIKRPKTARGIRTIQIDGGLAGLLSELRKKHQQIIAGVPDGAEVDLSLVRLPDGALLFHGGGGAALTQLRDGSNVSHVFRKQADALGFLGFRFHDLRGSHETGAVGQRRADPRRCRQGRA